MWLFVVSSIHAHSQTTCPWLTEGTAATALGGAAQVAVKLKSQQEGSCTFTSQSKAARSTLTIVVGRKPASSRELHCPANSPSLVGIGNTSVICHSAGKLMGDRQIVMSRVRDVYFSVALTAVRKEARRRDGDIRQDTVTGLAEQVAGNLF